ncbi:hypothetical protein DFS34DRAFT_696078 [Phlyctochytrium arcticum]|nr:hypothetical protein DFS34DRAFT_696078 [Phlyctochytrium arcticum]
MFEESRLDLAATPDSHLENGVQGFLVKKGKEYAGKKGGHWRKVACLRAHVLKSRVKENDRKRETSSEHNHPAFEDRSVFREGRVLTANQEVTLKKLLVSDIGTDDIIGTMRTHLGDDFVLTEKDMNNRKTRHGIHLILPQDDRQLKFRYIPIPDHVALLATLWQAAARNGGTCVAAEPMEYPPTSEVRVAVLLDEQGWNNPMAAFKNIQHGTRRKTKVFWNVQGLESAKDLPRSETMRSSRLRSPPVSVDTVAISHW